MVQTERVVSFDKIEIVLAIQNRKTESALHFFGHRTQAVEVEGLLFLNELDRYKAVGLHIGLWQLERTSQPVVVVKDAVVG